MALIKCPECGKEVSDKAGKCPNCGYPIEVSKSKEEHEEVDKSQIEFEGNKNNIREKRKPNKKIIILGLCIVFVIILGTALYMVKTADSRKYSVAQKLYEEEKFKEALQKYKELDSYNNSKDMVEKCEYELSVDGQFMRTLSKSLMARWKKSDEYEEDGIVGEDPDVYSEYCDIELKKLSEFYNKTFNNPKLQEDAKLYIDYLKAAKEATTYYTVDYMTYAMQWNDTYAKRTVLLKKFVDSYGLTVDKKYNETLNDLLKDAVSAQKQMDVKNSVKEMTKTFSIETIPNEFGQNTYKLNMVNSTNLTFEYFYADVNVLDTNGNILGNGNSNQVESWKPGTSASVQVFFQPEIPLEGCTLEYVVHYKSGSYFE